jgi:DNA polymerase III alpha subunit (gram-positive type)
MFRTFLFLDFETTDLTDPEVTEFCALAINRNFPERIRDKITICCSVQKQISPAVSRLTGITNEMISERCLFSKEGVEILLQFMKHLPAPICLLAHNGDKFDFKILQKAVEGMSGPQNVFSIDTFPLFKEIDETKGIRNRSYKLSCIHERLFGKDNNAKEHSAEADCETLAKCFFKLGGVEYLEANYEIR